MFCNICITLNFLILSYMLVSQQDSKLLEDRNLVLCFSWFPYSAWRSSRHRVDAGCILDATSSIPNTYISPLDKNYSIWMIIVFPRFSSLVPRDAYYISITFRKKSHQRGSRQRTEASSCISETACWAGSFPCLKCLSYLKPSGLLPSVLQWFSFWVGFFFFFW